MNVGVCFFFEDNDVDVWSGRDIDFDAWNYAIKSTGDITRVAVINKTNMILKPFDTLLDFKVYDDIVAFEEAESNKLLTYFTTPWSALEGSMSLWDFNHDTDWYIFGPANGWRKKGVYIPSVHGVALHSVHAASTVMFHRYNWFNC